MVLKGKWVLFPIEISEYEKFRRMASAETVSYYEKTRLLCTYGLSPIVERLLIAFLDEEIKIDLNENISTTHAVKKAVVINTAVWKRASEFMIALTAEGKTPKGRLGGLVVRLIRHYNREKEKKGGIYV